MSKVLTEQDYYTFFRCANEVILLVDKQLNIIFANEKACQLYGYTPLEWQNLNFNTLIFNPSGAPPQFFDDSIYCAVHSLKNNTLMMMEVSAKWIEVKGQHYYQAIIRPLAQKVQPQMIRLYDQCQKSQAQLQNYKKQWQKNKRYYQSLIETSPEGVMLLDLNARCVMLNHRLAKWCGLENSRDMVEHSVLEMILTKDQMRLTRALQHSITSRESYTARYGVLKKEGSHQTVILQITVLADLDNHPDAILVVFPTLEDPAQICVQDDNIKKPQEKITPHDDPLLNIIENAEVLKAALSQNPQWSQCVQNILLAAEQVSTSREKALSALGEEEGIQEEVLDVHQILIETLEILQRKVGPQIAIQQFLKAKDTLVVGEVSKIQNLFFKLGLNAQYAMPEGGVLRYTTHTVCLNERDIRNRHINIAPGEYIEIAIMNSGVGMKGDVKNHIFEPFIKIKGTDQEEDLTLENISHVVQELKGTMRVESQMRRGTTFKIYLPLVEEVDVEEEVQLETESRVLVNQSISFEEHELERNTLRIILQEENKIPFHEATKH